MAEYIEREAALSLCGWYNTVNGKSICAARKDELASLPAADVVEVKRGRWIDHMVRDWRCSECGEKVQKVRKVDGYCYDDLPNFCPNCGADMREG